MDGVDTSTCTCILFQNRTRDITLVDIPTSIAVAQGTDDTILSIPALEKPYVIDPEPKTAKGKRNLTKYLAYLSAIHTRQQDDIEGALETIRRHVSGPWCKPRKLLTQDPKPRQGNKSMDVDDPEKELDACLREWSGSKGAKGAKGATEAFNFDQMMAAINTSFDPIASLDADQWFMSCKPAADDADEPLEGEMARPGSDDATGNAIVVPEEREPWKPAFHNADNYTVKLTVSRSGARTVGEQEYSFRIPPKSAFFFTDAEEPGSFRASLRDLADEYALPRRFDFVLLDPPWPNASAKRKGDYEQFGGIPHLKRQIGRMDIWDCINRNAIVGVWITNSAKGRESVTGPNGIFSTWNVGLFEEWIWIKTTVSGEPVSNMDSVWKKPYETLLLGRAAPNAVTRMADTANIKRRVIAAVPDIHSRKPCLKELIEPYMPNPKDYSAIEIFSRYLVSGWTSCGNEVLKFNWDKHWASGSEDK
ncbi:MT-A70-domain-containing protein [Polyplosphaeria fusca]|uniref:MT-A70-domain-containing protein n=1 Tax=Polyplosphaeria fusca TaxID=682080 RepID=A0A9P4UU34_9PLEO|nr:MT-A70-domain-containing protein [Polyplosphaeria fusca]